MSMQMVVERSLWQWDDLGERYCSTHNNIGNLKSTFTTFNILLGKDPSSSKLSSVLCTAPSLLFLNILYIRTKQKPRSDR